MTRSEELRSDSEPVQRRTRTRAPWRDDFDGVMDRLGAALGGVCKYDSEYEEIICRTSAGLDVWAEGIPDRHAAYWYARCWADKGAERG